MAELSVNGLDGLMMSLSEIAQLPDGVAEAMLDAEADIVESAQVYTGMKMGVHRTGVTLSSITRGKLKVTKEGGRVKYVYPRGVNDQGARNAEVAFVNEFGAPRRGIMPRPFILTANEEAADAAVEAAAQIYDSYLKSKEL